MGKAPELTVLLDKVQGGDKNAEEEFYGAVYPHLAHIAHNRLRGERKGRTIGTVDLVAEAFMKLEKLSRINYQDREHFFAMASECMRRILIEAAHKRLAQKRGGGAARVDMRDDLLIEEPFALEILDLDDALRKLEVDHPRQAQVIKYRFFGGLEAKDVAAVLDISEATVKRDTTFAKAWLNREIERGDPTRAS